MQALVPAKQALYHELHPQPSSANSTTPDVPGIDRP
jgi:hypothetical protein